VFGLEEVESRSESHRWIPGGDVRVRGSLLLLLLLLLVLLLLLELLLLLLVLSDLLVGET
jgi:hypothetical protein